MFKELNIGFVTKFYEVEGNGKVKKDMIINHYASQGYSVYSGYKNLLLVDKDISNDIKALFTTFTTGYPDIMLKKGDKCFFVEIKLNRDGLVFNQIEFLSKLSKVANVEVCHFYNKESSIELDEDKLYSERVVKYKRIADQQGYDDFWVINKMIKIYSHRVFDNKNLRVLRKYVSESAINKSLHFTGTKLLKKSGNTRGTKSKSNKRKM